MDLIITIIIIAVPIIIMTITGIIILIDKAIEEEMKWTEHVKRKSKHKKDI